MENGQLPVISRLVSTIAWTPDFQRRLVHTWFQQPVGLFQPLAYTDSGLPKMLYR